MFAPTFGRLVRSGSTSPSASARFTRAVLGFGQPQSCLCPDIQRRLSSSKPPIPPKNSKHSAVKGSEPCTSQSTQRPKKRKSTAVSPAKERNATPFQNLPWIPPTNHLLENEVKLLSFLARDGPLPTRFDPWVRGTPDIDALFRPTSANEQHNIVRVIETVEESIRGYSAAIEAYQDCQEAEEEAPWLPDSSRINRPLKIQFVQRLPTTDELNLVLSRIPPYMPPPPPSPTVQPFPLTSYREHVAHRRGMYTISVKRQRKLKMKKHKYKKLMKRTRLLRRKLDRN